MVVAQSLQIHRNQRLRQGLLLGCLVAIIILALAASNAFAQIRLRLSSIYFVPQPTSGKLVLVAIDDASLAVYGRSLTQWSRAHFADFITYLSDAGARVAAFDILFVEPGEGDDAFAQAIAQARKSESRLRVIMPMAGTQIASNAPTQTQAIRFYQVLRPTSQLLNEVENTGFVNTFPDSDGVIRRQLSLIQAPGDLRFSFSLATYLAYLRIPVEAIPQVIETQPNGLKVTADQIIPVDELGLWIQNYFGTSADKSHPAFPIVSFRDVLTGKIPPTTFEDKIVVIGLMNSTGDTDQFPVPIDTHGDLMPGVEIQANAIETLLQNRVLHEQSDVSQVIMVAVLAIGASLIYAQVRWYLILPLGMLLLIAWIAFALVRFPTTLEIINLFHSGLAIALPVIGQLILYTSIEVSRRQKTEFLLESAFQTSDQRLELDKILLSIRSAIKRVLPEAIPEIWIPDEQEPRLKPLYHQHSQQQTSIIQDSQTRKRVVIERNQVALPILWRERMIGIAHLRFPHNRKVSQKSLAFLKDLAHQIAPNLENALLYSEVQRQKTLLESLLAGSPVGIVLLDQNLHLIQSNPAFNTIFPGTMDDMSSMRFLDVLASHTLASETRLQLVEKFKQKQGFRQEIRLQEQFFALDAAPLESYQQWVVILNDITAISELSNLKSRMIRMASHDLKNPLARILGYGSLIIEISKTDEPLPDQHERFINQMIVSAEEMNRIISDILDLEQIRSGGSQRERVDLEALARSVMQVQQPDASTKHQNIVSEIAPQVKMVWGNPRQLSQAVTNLIGNAIKYTPDGGQITVRLTNHNDHIQLAVEDTGYGIPEAAQAQLFTEFYRARTETTAHIPGTGLGLSLVKSVVESHGGRVWFKSQEGKGSTFFIELPVLRDKGEQV